MKGGPYRIKNSLNITQEPELTGLVVQKHEIHLRSSSFLRFRQDATVERHERMDGEDARDSLDSTCKS
jgi:hypothetical protein